MEKTFKLIKGDKNGKEFNIAKINSTKKIELTLKNAQFERRREKQADEVEEEAKEDDFEKNKESKKMARKTKAVQNVEHDQMLLRAKESRKWQLTVEDEVNQGEFEGQLLNHDMTHCLFILEKQGFRVIPTDSLYQFHAKRQSTLTIEEAEKLLQQRQQELKKITKTDDNERKDFKIVDTGTQNMKMAGSDDELDYDIGEEFADDEEGLAPIETEEQAEKQKKDLQKLRQSEEEESDDDKPQLNQAGKDLQKLLKNKNVDVADDDSDENPFKSDLSDAEDDSRSEIQDSQNPNEPKRNIDAATRKRTHPGESDLNLMNKRPKSESQYSAPVPSARTVTASVSSVLSEAEVVSIISANPGLSTKELLQIKTFRARIKAHPQNREKLSEIFKKVAKIVDNKVCLK